MKPWMNWSWVAALLVAVTLGCGPSKPGPSTGPGTGPKPGTNQGTPVATEPNCVLPSDATVLDGTYPLARPLFIYVNKEALKRPEVAAFVKFYLDHAKELATEVHYTPATDATYKKNQEDYAAAVGAAAPTAENSLSGSFTIDGSSTVYPISALVAEQFHGVQKQVKLVVNAPAGTGGGIKKFTAKEIEVLDASREITADEAKKLQAAGVEYVMFTVAMDGLAVIVNKENTWVNCITRSQLHAIWKDGSTVKTWKDVNPEWPDVPLKLYGPDASSGTFDYFTEAINGKSKSCRKEYSPSSDDNVLAEGVANDKGSLGYFGYSYYDSNKDKVKLLSVNGEKDKKIEPAKKEEKKPEEMKPEETKPEETKTAPETKPAGEGK